MVFKVHYNKYFACYIYCTCNLYMQHLAVNNLYIFARVFINFQMIYVCFFKYFLFF